MIDPKNIDYSTLPKKFCDSVIGSYQQGFFSISMCSGDVIDSYVMSPVLVLNMISWLQNQVINYEKQYGVINPPPPKPSDSIVSPLQPENL